ncbi:glycosyl transferase, partial [Streptomyces sp. SID339]|nr:glycosyl transferase [Streptomyces sp. SID339]
MRETANQFAAAGWDVTVVTIAEESWLRDSGVDHTLSESVDKRIRIVELPLSRA